MTCNQYNPEISKHKSMMSSYANQMRFLHDFFMDEIPEEILHTNKNNTTHKVQKAWFQVFLATLDMMISDGYVSKESEYLFNYFNNYLKEDKFHFRETKDTDIAMANKLLEKVIFDLEDHPINHFYPF